MEQVQSEDWSTDVRLGIEYNQLNQVYQRRSPMDTLNIELDRRDCTYRRDMVKERQWNYCKHVLEDKLYNLLHRHLAYSSQMHMMSRCFDFFVRSLFPMGMAQVIVLDLDKMSPVGIDHNSFFQTRFDSIRVDNLCNWQHHQDCKFQVDKTGV